VTGRESILTGTRIAVFLLVCVFLVFSNHFDWDFFLGFNEVDRRSWLHDFAPPRWSYQICAGTTRIADPQALGLSPLFLLVVVFGTFWGTKMIGLLALGYGLFASASLYRTFDREGGGTPIETGTLITLATLFVLSNFFMWHLMVGHFTFFTFFLGLGIAGYTLKGFCVGLSRREFAIAVLVTWQHYSGSFFHSTAYFLVPFLAAFGFFAVYRLIESTRSRGGSIRDWLRRVFNCSAFHVVGVLIASYKLIPVWQYQQQFPRNLKTTLDSSSVVEFLAYNFMPTWQDDWLLSFDQLGKWAVHEYSAFSLFPIVLLALSAQFFLERIRDGAEVRRDVPLHPLTGFVVIYLVLCTLLTLGDFARNAPYTLFNNYVAEGAVRIAARFCIGVTLAMSLGCVLLLKRLRIASLPPLFQFGLLMLLAANIAGFAWMLDYEKTAGLWGPAASNEKTVRTLQYIRLHSLRSNLKRGQELNVNNSTSMYPTLRTGLGVINCYNPLQAQDNFFLPPRRKLGLISTEIGNPSRECLENSHYAQNRVHIDPSCPQEVCLNVAWINPNEATEGIRWNPEREQHCRE